MTLTCFNGSDAISLQEGENNDVTIIAEWL